MGLTTLTTARNVRIMSVSHTPGEWTTKVRKRVRSLIAEHEVSASEVARRAGWTQQYLARRLTPRKPVAFSIDDLEVIAHVIGIDPAKITTDLERVAA